MRTFNGADSTPGESILTTRNFKADGRHGWGQKIAAALGKEGKPLSTEELIEVLEREYPMVDKTTDRRVYYTTQIFHACKREWIRLQYNCRRKGYYCLPEWYGENGIMPDTFYEIMNRICG